MKYLIEVEILENKNTSSKPIATESAAPVDRNGRLACCTGQGSR